MSSSETQFGSLRLTAEGTCNGRGFDILYDFSKSFNFAEFQSKPRFMFIQPWMQFPSQEYTDECKLVSIELVKRFNDYERILEENKTLKKLINKLTEERDKANN